MYQFETHMTGSEATTEHSKKDKWSRASCYAYPVCLTLLAGNQTNMLNIIRTSAHDIILLPLRQRHLHGPCCCSSSVTHCPVVTVLEPTTGYTFFVLCTEGKRKLEEETAFEQKGSLEIKPLIVFQQLGQQTHFSYKSVCHNWTEGIHE